MAKKIIIKDADFSENALASSSVPVTGLAITGGDNIEEGVRQVQLAVVFTPSDTTQLGVAWSVSGDATITQNGLLTYNGAASGLVVVTVTSTKISSISSSKTISFVVPNVESPVLTPSAGTYSSAQSVAIACATSGATIHYTTDGSTPTASSPVYSTPIAVNSTTTIKAVAIKDGLSSAVVTAQYIINATLVVNVTDENSAAVTDATVTFDDTELTHSGSGVYTAQVPRGATGTLAVSKTQHITNTQQVTVNDNTVTVNVSIEFDPVIDIVEAQGCILKKYLCPSSYTNKLMLQASPLPNNGGNRSGILIPSANASIHCPWSGDSSASSSDKAAYSCPEWPSWAGVLDVKLLNPGGGLKVGIFMGNAPSGGSSAQSFTGGGWLTSFSKRLLRTSYANTLYIAISYNGLVEITAEQLKDYVSIMAFKDTNAANAWYAENGGTAPST